MLAPIVLFVYNRPWHTRQTLESLSRNFLANQSELFIFADGPKEGATPDDFEKIYEVHQVINEKLWCGKVTIAKSDSNKGLADSIVSGVTKILADYGKVIVLEDDLVTSPGFLRYMNNALDLYINEKKVMHISGYMFPIKRKLPSTFFYNITTCWGWATWSDRWIYFRNDAKALYHEINSSGRLHEFNLDNCADFIKQMEINISGINNTWAIKWYASIFLERGMALHPYPSLVNNIGHDLSGENCTVSKKFNWEKLAENIPVNLIKLKESRKARAFMKSYYKTNFYAINWYVYMLKRIIPSKIKSVLKNLFDEKFRRMILEKRKKLMELKRIQNIPRFIKAQSNILGTPVTFVDASSFLFMYDEIFEKGIYNFKNSSKKPYIIDCGANIGLSIIYFKKTYPLSTILGFEPDPDICQILKENIKKFDLKEVIIEEKGVWNEETNLSFFSDGADGGRISFKSGTNNLIRIHTIRLKEYLTSHVDLLKIDIEGAETKVLKDCSDSLENVDKIFVEYHSFSDRQQDLQELLEVLSNAGFRYYIQQVGITSPTPFITINSFNKIDNQLNIFAYRT
jgi:FkbM family methyltransferase